MRTTVRLNEKLLKEAKKKAAEEGTTLTALLDQGLRMVLREATPDYDARSKPFHITTFNGGGMNPDIDPSSNADLYDVADGLDVSR
jgi:hypothetical protein